jgi:hypothetical protein
MPKLKNRFASNVMVQPMSNDGVDRAKYRDFKETATFIKK